MLCKSAGRLVRFKMQLTIAHETPDYWEQATRELAERDAVLRELIERFQGLALGSRGDAFSTLARSIVGQQISVKAAQSVWNRLSDRLGTVTPDIAAPLPHPCPARVRAVRPESRHT